ncbi:hypothetical protein O0544_06185 [Edwardsiella anguillarum]|nr:hypothetical protein [Edwardsiella anguillarum]
MWQLKWQAPALHKNAAGKSWLGDSPAAVGGCMALAAVIYLIISAL